MNILIIDDDPFYTHVACKLIEGNSHVLEECNDPTKLKLASLRDYDLILLDIMMPGMDGVQMLDKIQQYSNNTKVILATSVDQAVIESIVALAKQMEVNIIGVLRKPYKASELQSILAKTESSPDKVEHLNPDEILAHFDEVISRSTILLQPQISLSSRDWVGCDASIRWNDAKDRNKALNALSISRDNPELSAGISLKVLSTYINTAKNAVSASGRNFDLSAKISASALMDKSFYKNLKLLLQTFDFNGHHLILALNEYSMLLDEKVFQENIQLLKNENIRLSNGHAGNDSSFPRKLINPLFNELKIDKRLTRNLDSQQSSESLVRILLDYGSRLCIPVIADGIESKNSLQWLSANGCDIGQGNLVGPPMGIPELLHWHNLRRTQDSTSEANSNS
jgi:EAL domain-containing protein (putative c-di-GMP-specific phosphodiesterase class I)